MTFSRLVAVAGLMMCLPSLHAATEVVAFRYYAAARPVVAVVSAKNWVHEAREDESTEQLATTDLHLRSRGGFFGDLGYVALREGDVLAPGVTCKGCSTPLFVYRGGALLKVSGGYGDALTSCTSPEKASCFHLNGISVRTTELETGRTTVVRVDSTPALFRALFPYPPENLNEKSAAPRWGAEIIPVAAAHRLEDEAQRRQADLDATLRKRILEQRQRLAQAEQEAVALVRSAPVGSELNCSSPAGTSMQPGTPLDEFELACSGRWPTRPDMLPVTVTMREFTASGWSIAQQTLTPTATGRLHLYVNLRKSRTAPAAP